MLVIIADEFFILKLLLFDFESDEQVYKRSENSTKVNHQFDRVLKNLCTLFLKPYLWRVIYTCDQCEGHLTLL